MLLKSGSLKVPPAPLAIVERKTKLKLLGVTFENDPVNWDSHIDHVLSKASSRLYILRVCRFYGCPKEQLDLLFQSLIISVFTYAIEVWGCCYYDKYLKRIDKLFARAFKSGYCLNALVKMLLKTVKTASKKFKKFFLLFREALHVSYSSFATTRFRFLHFDVDRLPQVSERRMCDK